VYSRFSKKKRKVCPSKKKESVQHHQEEPLSSLKKKKNQHLSLSYGFCSITFFCRERARYLVTTVNDLSALK
jgi:hypothetical protein